MRSSVDIDTSGWQVIADELAAALRTTMLRNPTVSTQDWNRAQAALGRYESAGGAVPAALPEQPDGEAAG